MKNLLLALLPLYFNAQSQTIQQVIRSEPNTWSSFSKRSPAAFSWTDNPALLAYHDQWSVGISAEEKYLLKELSIFKASFFISALSGGAAMGVQHAGSSLYSETSLAIAYGKSFGKLLAGVKGNYHTVNISGNDHDKLLQLDAGIVWQLNNELTSGFYIKNFLPARFQRSSTVRIPLQLSYGIAYDLSNAVSAALELHKEQADAFAIRALLNYELNKKVFCGISFNSASLRPAFSTGICWGYYRIDIFGSYHPQLGLSTGIQLIFLPKKKTP